MTSILECKVLDIVPHKGQLLLSLYLLPNTLTILLEYQVVDIVRTRVSYSLVFTVSPTP